MIIRSLLLLTVLASLLSGQSTLVVPSATYPTIQSALNAAATGDTVDVAAGTYFENIVWPNAEITLKGAGPGLSIIDGGQLGSCVTINYGGLTSVLEGFTITNGLGDPLALTSSITVLTGGGVRIKRTTSNYISPTIKNCEFSNCSATLGGAVFVQIAAVTLEDCVFSGNTVVASGTAAAAQPHGAAVYLEPQGSFTIKIEGCSFHQNNGTVIENGAGWDLFDFILKDSTFSANNGEHVLGIGANNFDVESCSFTSNTSTSETVLLAGGGATPLNFFRVRSCLIADNTASRALLTNCANQTFNFQNLSNLTIARNTTTSEPISLFGHGLLSDCIIKANKKPTGQTYNNPIIHPSNNWVFIYNFQNSNIQGMAGQGPGLIDVPAQFVDSLGGDFRLLPGSPMIDTGTVAPSYPISSADVRGLARVKGAAIDLGAYESQSLAHHPASSGQVGSGFGGPFEILTLNGSTGGPLRTISLPIGSASSMEMAQPPHLVGPLKFAVFGFLGEATFDSVINVPLGIGDMMFAPSPMVPPFFQSIFFTFTDNFSPSNPQLFPSTPTPWNSGLGPGVPFPLTLTFVTVA